MFKDKNKINCKKGNKIYISQKAYNNPYFKSAKKGSDASFVSLISWKTKLIIFLFFLFLTSMVWFFFYSKFFLIYDLKIEIEKVNDIGGISESDIEKIVREKLRTKFIFFPGNNIFLFDENKLKESLNTELAFENINITKKLPNKLVINIKEVSYALIWKEDDRLYYMTTRGEVIKEVPPEEIKNIFPKIVNKGRQLIFDGKISDKDNHFKISIQLYKDFKDTNVFNIENFIVGDQNENTLTMKIVEGPEVYFNVTADVEPQKEKLILLKEERLKNELFSKTYIDLRYGDMIYYR